MSFARITYALPDPVAPETLAPWLEEFCPGAKSPTAPSLIAPCPEAVCPATKSPSMSAICYPIEGSVPFQGKTKFPNCAQVFGTPDASYEEREFRAADPQ